MLMGKQGGEKQMSSGVKEYASRKKYWSELTDSERIERMRKIIKGQDTTISRLQKEIVRLLSHKHLNGAIVVNLDDLEVDLEVDSYMSPQVKNEKEAYI